MLRRVAPLHVFAAAYCGGLCLALAVRPAWWCLLLGAAGPAAATLAPEAPPPATAPPPAQNTPPPEFAGIDPRLAALMRADNVTPAQLKHWYVTSGRQPASVEPANIPALFAGRLVAAWPQALTMIRAQQKG